MDDLERLTVIVLDERIYIDVYLGNAKFECEERSVFRGSNM